MHRSKLGARRISSTPEPPFHEQQQQQFCSQSGLQPSMAADYHAGITLYNPNDMVGRILDQQPSVNPAVDLYQQSQQHDQQQVSWPTQHNPPNAYQEQEQQYQHRNEQQQKQQQQQQQQQQWNEWSSRTATGSYYGTYHWDESSNVPTTMAQQPQYVEQSQQSQSLIQPENSWVSQSNVILHRNFSDTWNWGSGDESADVSVSSQHSNAGSAVALNHLQSSENKFATGYQNYDSGTHQQGEAHGYDQLGLRTTTTEIPQMLDSSAATWGRKFGSGVQQTLADQPSANIHNGIVERVTEDWPTKSTANTDDYFANVNSEIRPSSSRCFVVGSNANDWLNGVDSSRMSTYFRNSEDEDRLSVSTEIEPIRREMTAEGTSAVNSESSFSVPSVRAPYIRGDSCISNSSLMTFNPSTVGSVEELPSGSFYGDDNSVSVGNLPEAIENLRLSVRDSSRRNLQQRHPLNQGSVTAAALAASGDVSEVSESLPLFADRNTIMGGVDPAHFGRQRRSSVPNALISNNEENPANSRTGANTDVSTSADVEDCVYNVEVPPSLTHTEAEIGLASDAERILEKSDLSPEDTNVEVVDASGTPIGPSLAASFTPSVMWSREYSAFQPFSSRNASNSEPVSQQKLLNIGQSSILVDEPKVRSTDEAVNLETLPPDNVEYPLDPEALVEPPAPSKSTLHLIVSARQHAREMRASSPSAPLWDNPELPRGFEMVVPPTSSTQLSSQGAIFVPLLGYQREVFDTNLDSSDSASAETSKTKADFRNVPDDSEANNVADNLKDLSLGPLDLSSRSMTQAPGRFDTSQVQDVSPVVSAVSRQTHPIAEIRTEHLPLTRYQEEGVRRSTQPPPNSDQSERQSKNPWSMEDHFEGSRAIDERRRYSIGSKDGSVDYRQSHDGRHRGSDRPGREWDSGAYVPPSYYSSYGHQPERERSRPSSRSSSHDGHVNDQERHYFDQRRHYPLASETSVSQRPPSVGRSGAGYDSDQDAYQRRRPHPDYDYYRDQHYAACEEYYRYSRDPRYDPRNYQQPSYYPMTSYNYGYYQELYGNDARYKAYYESLAKNYYGAPYAGEHDRRSAHSGRSSVTDGSQRISGDATYQDAIHRESPISQNASTRVDAWEQSTIYPLRDSFSSVADVAVDQQATNEVEQVISFQRLTPAKFAIPHLKATFGSSGHFVIVLPNNIVDGHSAQVEISDVHNVFAEDSATKELQAFPGPLVRCDTHKNDVIQFCMQKVRQLRKETNADLMPDRESCALIWELLVLLVRQNGVVVGTDIAELLLRDHKTSLEAQTFENVLVEEGAEESPSSPDEGVVINSDFSATNIAVQSSEELVTKKFRDYLLFGHKKDALEWAMKHGLWGHALFLASKMDNRTYAMVMTRFANSLALNDPLQSLYQLMSGRQPAAVTCIADEKWGDWRPHLAMILSNSSTRPDLDRRSVVTLGDTLAARGCLHAAHFCYLMAQVDFGNFDKKSSKLVLIGSNHGLPFLKFATNEAIQCTEIYEYVQSLASPHFALASLQAYKYIYATRLAECGQMQEALHYAEVITQTIRGMPSQFNLELVRRVHELASRLKFHDPYYTQEEFGEPVWFQELGAMFQAYSEGVVQQSNAECVDQSQIDSSLDCGANPNQVGTSQNSQQQQYTVREEPEIQQRLSNVSLHYRDSGQETGAYSDGGQQESHQIVDDPSRSGEHYYDGGQSSMAGYDGFSNVGTSVDQHVEKNYMVSGESNRSDVLTSAAGHGPQAQSPRHASTDYYGASTYADSGAISYIGGGDTTASSNLPLPSSPSGRTPSTSNIGSSPLPSKVTELPGVKRSSSSNKIVKGNIGAVPKQSSWLGGIFSRFSLLPKNQMNLPDDKNPLIVWDPASGLWLNTDGDEETDNASPIAPPKDLEFPPGSAAIPGENSVQRNMPLSPSVGQSTSTTPAMTAENRFKLRHGRGMRQNYVDVLRDNTVSVSSAVPLPDGSHSALSQTPVQYFIPAPVSAETSGDAINFVTPAARVGNPGSHGGSPHQSDSESDNTNHIETDGQPRMYNPSSVTHSVSTTTTPPSTQNQYQTTGLQKKYGTRYPR